MTSLDTRADTRARTSSAFPAFLTAMSTTLLAFALSACATAPTKATANAPGSVAAGMAEEPQPLQFDNGSYTVTRNGTLIATFHVDSGREAHPEIWVFPSNGCTTVNCDISGAKIELQPELKTCANWKDYAEENIESRKVYGAAFEREEFECEQPSCKYIPDGTEHSFSLFPLGTYQHEDTRPRIFVEAAGHSTRREYWIMDTFIGENGARLSRHEPRGMQPPTLSEYACDTCQNEDERLNVYKVTYTLMNGIECSDS